MVFHLNTGLMRKVPSSSKLYRKRRECNKQVKRERNKLFNLTNYYLEGEYLFYPLNNNVKKKKRGYISYLEYYYLGGVPTYPIYI